LKPSSRRSAASIVSLSPLPRALTARSNVLVDH
jgi:hypothetical protein